MKIFCTILVLIFRCVPPWEPSLRKKRNSCNWNRSSNVRCSLWMWTVSNHALWISMKWACLSSKCHDETQILYTVQFIFFIHSGIFFLHENALMVWAGNNSNRYFVRYFTSCHISNIWCLWNIWYSKTLEMLLKL